MMHLQWIFWKNYPQWMPLPLRLHILALSPYRCDCIGQGSPMVVMRREAWDAGIYEAVPGAPCNIEGENWIIQDWIRTHPDFTPHTLQKN